MRYLLMAAMVAAPVVTLAEQVAMTPSETATAATPAPALPKDPLQKMAYQAVVLRLWPTLPPWKEAVYKRVLAEGLTIDGHARRTTYCPACSGRHCADGSPVRLGICAASRNVPMHAIIWLETEGLLKVTDRGGAVRVPGGRENAHFDVWCPRCAGDCWNGPGTKRAVPWALIPPAR